MAKPSQSKSFRASLGANNDVLPGDVFTVFETIIYRDGMIFISQEKERYFLDFSQITEASFSSYQFEGNLWFSCLAEGKHYCFCASPSDWKSSEGKRLLQGVCHYVKIQNLKDLATYLHDGLPTFLIELLLH
jgi:hypothetical protein